MACSLRALVGFSTLATLASCNCVPHAKPHFQWEDIEYLIAFGDSYTYVQGTAGHTNYSFIGDLLPGDVEFTPQELLSNKIVQNFTGTANAGPNWVEFLTGCAVEDGEYLPQSCDIQLWDFAFAGADVSEEYLPLHHNFTMPLVNQSRQYLTWAEPVIGGKMDKTRALVAVWIGINDISDSMGYTNISSYPAFWEDIISTIFEETVQPIHDAGYHSFLFVNLPPLDRTAANQRTSEPSPNKTQIGWWNDILASHIQAFAEQNSGAKAMLYDANTFLNGVMDNPGQYGITNLTYCPGYAELDVLTDPGKYGCQPLDEYFWYNSGHM
ncbi:hypothetical protein BJ170DRAFT_700053 [Xylariales sp. AK1849]|nr:hypothetical protein BJ170DRAFT_700053 [Xylariales sp. AK1849]